MVLVPGEVISTAKFESVMPFPNLGSGWWAAALCCFDSPGLFVIRPGDVFGHLAVVRKAIKLRNVWFAMSGSVYAWTSDLA